MIKYKVLAKQIDNNYVEVGIIEGETKRELAFKLNRFCHIYNLRVNEIKL